MDSQAVCARLGPKLAKRRTAEEAIPLSGGEVFPGDFQAGGGRVPPFFAGLLELLELVADCLVRALRGGELQLEPHRAARRDQRGLRPEPCELVRPP